LVLWDFLIVSGSLLPYRTHIILRFPSDLDVQSRSFSHVTFDVQAPPYGLHTGADSGQTNADPMFHTF